MIKATYQKYKKLLPVNVLALLCVWTVVTLIRGTVEFNGQEYEFTLTIKHYAAFAAVMINFVVFFIRRQYYKYVLAATLLLGLFGLLNFTPIAGRWVIRFGNLGIGLQPVSFLVGLLTIALNFEAIKVALGPSNSPEDLARNLAAKQKAFQKEVEKFKQKYTNVSSDELIKVLADKRYTDAAIEAAGQILEERKLNNQ
jgi:hypothetical protein